MGDYDSKVRQLAERSVWQRFKDSFRPASARAEDEVNENRYSQSHDSDTQDMLNTPTNLRIRKLMQGSNQ